MQKGLASVRADQGLVFTPSRWAGLELSVLSHRGAIDRSSTDWARRRRRPAAERREAPPANHEVLFLLLESHVRHAD